MNKLPLFLFVMFALSACDTVMSDASPLATATISNQARAAQALSPAPTSTMIATPTVDAVKTALVVIEIDRATGTAEAASTSTAYAVTATQEAKATQAFWVAVTLDVSTQQADETRVAKTETAGTAQAEWRTQQPPTQTALAATQIIEQDQLQSKRVSTWIWNLGWAFAGVAVLWLVVFALFISVRYGKSLGEADVAKKSQIKPDEQGRYPLVPEKALGGGKLVNANLMHRSVLDTTATDTLTNEQALDNTRDARQLEKVRSVAGSPAIRKIAENMMKRPAGTTQSAPTAPNGGVTITKPELPKLPVSEYPELPQPSWTLLNKWDGKLLPFGVDEKQELMRVDTATRPHFMVVGRSRSGKTLSSIRPMVACLLTMGWNVIVMGKRVDFMPFEEHPNFKLLAVDVRKDARKYISLLQTLTAQMDIRDQILASKRVSTWDRYGAPSTMIVVDDYSGALERMPKKDAAEVVSEVKSIAMDGAKFGLNLMVGLQRPTWENIDTTIRSQMGRIVYAVDAGDSRIVLDEDGAERLPAQWNFLTRMTDDSSVQRGVGFRLQDREIETFLASRPAKQNETLDWIDAEVTERVTAETPMPAAPVSTPLLDEKGVPISAELQDAYRRADEEIELEDKIAGVWMDCVARHSWEGWNYVERAIYGEVKNGARQAKIKKVVAGLLGVEVIDVNRAIADLVKEWGTTDTTTRSTTEGATPGTTAILPNLGLNLAS